jgi:hypothetical protein
MDAEPQEPWQRAARVDVGRLGLLIALVVLGSVLLAKRRSGPWEAVADSSRPLLDTAVQPKNQSWLQLRDGAWRKP